MRQILKELVPPLVLSAVKNIRSAQSPVFNSFEQALDACGADGYQAKTLVDVVVAKNEIYRNKIQSSRTIGLEAGRTMIGISAITPCLTLRVLDFGGGGGSHYALMRTTLGQERDIKWHVVETEAIAKAAAEKLSGGGLKFFSTIDEAAADLGEIDLVFTSGALQYTPDPLAFLSKLIGVKARHIFITRTALNHDNDDSIVGVQTSMLSDNGPGPLPSGFSDYKIKYPITLASKRKAEQLLNEAYHIRFSVEEDKDAYSVSSRPFHMYGYFCDLR